MSSIASSAELLILSIQPSIRANELSIARASASLVRHGSFRARGPEAQEMDAAETRASGLVPDLGRLPRRAPRRRREPARRRLYGELPRLVQRRRRHTRRRAGSRVAIPFRDRRAVAR